jgi:DNA repair exonuclease SbcCD nuclease subunit
VKILFTADLHIKLGQKNVPVDWAKNRYKLLFNKLSEISSTVDLTVLGGDIFDKVPNMEELELYFELISSINSKCIIYSGNHEAVKRNTTFLTNLDKASNLINKRITIIDDFCTIDGIDFIPYNKLKEYNPADIDFHSDILCTHVRGDIPPHVKAEIPLQLLDRWKVVLAGDLHSYANSQRNILYPGSPITTSFHRGLVDTGIILFDSSTLSHIWQKLELPQLIRKTIKVGDPMPATDYHHTIYEIEGDMSELSNMESSDLIDKKVVKRDTDTTLILAPTMSLLEEVEEYLLYVLQLKESSVHNILKELNNHMGELVE